MKPFEVVYLFLMPYLPPLYGHVHDRLVNAVQQLKSHTRLSLRILDVGGRKSHYTIGLDARITISELPRESELQERLNLGINDAIVTQILRRRSNVEAVVYDDMVDTQLTPGAYDIVVAVEVLEHVEADAKFVSNVFRLLRPGGLYIMTTPNGDYLTRVTNPDHKRHYRREQLAELLQQHFPEVDVYYAIKGGRFRDWGLRAWSPRNPLRTFKSALGNFINRRESATEAMAHQAYGTHHLVAIARKFIPDKP